MTLILPEPDKYDSETDYNKTSIINNTPVQTWCHHLAFESHFTLSLAFFDEEQGRLPLESVGVVDELMKLWILAQMLKVGLSCETDGC